MQLFQNIRDFRRDPIRSTIIESLDYTFAANTPSTKVINFLKSSGEIVADRIIVVGFGKAAIEMYKGAKDYLGERIWRSAIIAPEYEIVDDDASVLPGGHPLPTSESIKSSLRLLDSLNGLKDGDLVVVLISGGGSSLFEVLRDGINLELFNESINCLMKNGANISEINAIRYVYSEVKGGGLLKYTFPAKVLGLIISDVPGDDVNTVASGPTGSPPSRETINHVMEKFGRVCQFSKNYKEEPRNQSYCVNHIILRNLDFVNSVVEFLKRRGEEVVSLGSGIQGSTIETARLMLDNMRMRYENLKRGFFVVGGGETSTTRIGHAKGGRNLELCLRALALIEEGEKIYFGSFGTDGVDGSSGAMGAIVDNHTLALLGKKKIDEFLSKSESLLPLQMTQDVIFTGPTGTNVSDIFISYYSKE
ncbi:MAG: DUF4147 domain-containing protein [Thermoplasmatales archaeon]